MNNALDFVLVPRNIVISFDEKLTSQLIKYSQEINKLIPSKVVLNKTDQLPHMSIYSTNFPEYNLREVNKRLTDFVKSQKPFKVTFSSKVVDMKTIFINADPNKKLQNLHNILVDQLNDLREGLYDEKELGFIGDHKERRISLVKYGMWAAKELYVPHISISRPKDSTQCKRALDLLPNNILFRSEVKRVSLVERGHDGTCKRVIQTYLFNKGVKRSKNH